MNKCQMPNSQIRGPSKIAEKERGLDIRCEKLKSPLKKLILNSLPIVTPMGQWSKVSATSVHVSRGFN